MSLLLIAAIRAGTWNAETFIIIFGSWLPAMGVVAYRILPARRPRLSKTRAADDFLVATTLLFGFAAILDGVIGWGSSGPPDFMNHERAFVAILCLLMPLRRAQTAARLVVSIGLVLAMVRYPSATTLAAVVCAVITLLVLRLKSRARTIAAIVLGGGLALLLVPLADALLADYYDAVGRTDNSATRLVLWAQGLAVLSGDPVGGGWASAPITGWANVAGIVQPVPFHNSALTIAVAGGLVALGLTGFLLAAVLFNGVWSVQSAPDFARVWVPTLTAAIVCATVNPVLERPGTAIPFYTVVFVNMFVHRGK
jgi:hypothetical protein